MSILRLRRRFVALGALATGCGLLGRGASAHEGELPVARKQQRDALLQQGEAALLRLEVSAALRAFESAAGLQHAADSELGLVRTYMQGGEYRRALAFAAHTAKAHRGAPGSAALYVWLLALGGYGEQAKAVLAEMQIQEGSDPLLVPVRQCLQRRALFASDLLLQAPARLAPYAEVDVSTKRRLCTGSGLLFDGGRRALVPTKLASPKSLWVRDGLGRTSRARPERSLALGLTVLRLEQRLQAADLPSVMANAFPGSVVYGVEYVNIGQTEPAWPVLTAGFLGAPLDSPGACRLDLDLPPGPRGGPAFDAWGRCIGLALSTKGMSDRLLPATALRSALGEHFGPMTLAKATPRMSNEEIYERALPVTVQVLANANPGVNRGRGS